MKRKLNFPNPSLSYDEQRRGVLFWAYDTTIEVPFFIDSEALAKLHSAASMDKAECLNAFNLNRDRIFKAAASAYSQQRRSSYALTASDF